MSGGLIVNTSTIRNTVEFVVDRNSMKEAMDAFDQIQKKAKGIKDPTLKVRCCILLKLLAVSNSFNSARSRRCAFLAASFAS